MQIKEKIIELGKQLPRGSFAVIAEKTGLRRNTITDIFKGRTNPNIESLRLIMPVAQELIKEINEILELLKIKD